MGIAKNRYGYYLFINGSLARKVASGRRRDTAMEPPGRSSVRMDIGYDDGNEESAWRKNDDGADNDIDGKATDDDDDVFLKGDRRNNHPNMEQQQQQQRGKQAAAPNDNDRGDRIPTGATAATDEDFSSSRSETGETANKSNNNWKVAGKQGDDSLFRDEHKTDMERQQQREEASCDAPEKFVPAAPLAGSTNVQTASAVAAAVATTPTTSSTTTRTTAALTRRPPPPETLNFKDQVRDAAPPIVLVVDAQAVEEESVATAVLWHNDSNTTGSENRNNNLYHHNAVSSMATGFSSTSARDRPLPAYSRTFDATEDLIQQGFPTGLALELQQTRESFPLRLWVVDNSGSMLNSDCTRVVEAENGKMEVIKCSRWNELQCTVQRQARLARILHATTSFRLLNQSRVAESVSEFTVNNLDSDVELANEVMMSTKPDGVTPLTEHIHEMRNRIAAIQNDLVANGRKAVVVIATDGLPSDQFGESPYEVREEFCNAIKMLQLLPVWIVIRLCTSENAVLKYYQKLDKQLERPLECISNYTNEAKEIRKCNAWLNYGLPLHRCREMGFHNRIFDLLDERELTLEEMRECLDLLFGATAFVGAPDIYTEWKAFAAFFAIVIRREKRQWCPHSKRLEDWIDLRKLNLIYGGGLVGSIRRRMVTTMTSSSSSSSSS